MRAIETIRRVASMGFAGTAAILLAAALDPSPRASEAASLPLVRLSVVRVRASGAQGSGVAPEIDAKLDRLHLGRLRLGYARYVEEETVERTLPLGESVRMPVDATKDGDLGGHYAVGPVAPGAEGKFVVHVEEVAPGGKKPCLETKAEVQPGRVHLWFCDGAIDGGTILFFVTAQPAG